MNEQIPEYYGDVFYLRTSVWGVATTFAVQAPKDGIEAHDICVVRLGHESAKALAMLLRKQLKTYERDSDTVIALPTKVMNELGLASEDW